MPFFYDVPYKIGSQNLSKYQSGSYTGEILASQLKSLKIEYVLLNHAEANEIEMDVIQKIKNATFHKIKVVLCIGEKEQLIDSKVITILEDKIKFFFDNLTNAEQKNIILAYEPHWAINKGYTINKENLTNIITELKIFLKKEYQLELPIIYGGSINKNNILNLTKIDNLDGYLIGNSANNPENIINIIEKT